MSLFDEQALRTIIADVVREVVREELGRPTGSEYLDVAAAASVASVTPQTIRGWIREGKLEGCRAGREWRVKRAELELLLETGAASSENPEAAAFRLLGGGKRR